MSGLGELTNYSRRSLNHHLLSVCLDDHVRIGLVRLDNSLNHSALVSLDHSLRTQVINSLINAERILIQCGRQALRPDLNAILHARVHMVRYVVDWGILF